MNRLLAAGLLLCALGARAEAPPAALPAYLTLPPEVQPASDSTMQFEEYGEDEFRLPGEEAEKVERGRHWVARLTLAGATDDTRGKEVWAKLKPALLQGGWQVVGEYDETPFVAVFRYRKAGKDAIGRFSSSYASDMSLRLIEVAPLRLTLTLKAPAATPEKVSAEDGDFPYLAPIAGSKRTQSGAVDGPMAVVLPGSDEPQLVGSGSIVKSYEAPGGVSNIAFVTLYARALAQAGWSVVTQSQGLHQTDAAIVAHYVKGGRDLWAYLHNSSNDYSFAVADAGKQSLGKQLASDCHVALYGVLFDFNKSSLKPESASILGRVAGLLKADGALELEVQGHTDNVGDDQYNQTLSEARAKAVAAWLESHGVAPGRLTAKGYGRTRPVASNDEDAGRAKNRRVEIAKPGCAAR